MEILFYISAAVAVLATVGVITSRNAIHALLYMIVSLLSVALVFFSVGAHFVAALEVIVYAGAIMVLFVFVVMMLNLGRQSVDSEKNLMPGGIWIGPAALTVILVAEVTYLILASHEGEIPNTIIPPADVGEALFSVYLLGAELASMLLLAGLVGAYHLARPSQRAAGPQEEP